MQENGSAPIENAATGRQRAITGVGTGAPGAYDSPNTLAGQTLQPGTYKYQLPIAGASIAVDVTLNMSSHTGTAPTPKIYLTYADGLTQKGSVVNFAQLADGAIQTASLTTLHGEKIAVLEILVPAASSATFAAPTEYSAL